jgi:hypothetical protein
VVREEEVEGADDLFSRALGVAAQVKFETKE